MLAIFLCLHFSKQVAGAETAKYQLFCPYGDNMRIAKIKPLSNQLPVHRTAIRYITSAFTNHTKWEVSPRTTLSHMKLII